MKFLHPPGGGACFALRLQGLPSAAFGAFTEAELLRVKMREQFV
jgi:hypothetical protein